MSWIRRSIVAAGAFYILLMIAEVISHPEILPGAIAGSVLLGIIAGAFLYHDEGTIHSAEMVFIWVMILLFILYGGLCLAGVIPWI